MGALVVYLVSMVDVPLPGGEGGDHRAPREGCEGEGAGLAATAHVKREVS